MARFEVLQGDANSLIGTLNDESIDLIVFDPAYESLEKHRSKGTTTRLTNSKASSNNWFPVVSNEYLAKHLRECYRVLKPGTHLYMLCNQETAFNLHSTVISIGFKFWKCLVWDKRKLGMGYHYRCRHEWIMFLEKVEKHGKHRQLNDSRYPDILEVDSLRGNQFYPTEKPVELIEILVLQSSNPGDIILDTFAGSGSTLEASLKHGRNAIGFDLQNNAIKKINERAARFGRYGKVAMPRIQMPLLAI